MIQLFWKTYKITLRTTDSKLENTQFMRGFPWGVVEMAIQEAKEKSEKEKLSWGVVDIKKI